jgi:trichothecene 3-O-acetyltransferase
MGFDDNLFIQGPAFHVDLAAIDAQHPVHYSRRHYIFRCTSHAQRDAQLEALKAAVKVLVARCPILAGMVVPLPPEEAIPEEDDWRTIVPRPGLELVVRDLSSF